jgi:hypothetical protein
MPTPMRSGRARISLRRPRAMGECDVCGGWHTLDDMVPQYQWVGNELRNLGLLVGRDCLDKPQDQFRSLILPADPTPRINPRPSSNATQVPSSLISPEGALPTSPENQGFTVYILGLNLCGTAGTFTLDQSALDGPDVMA